MGKGASKKIQHPKKTKVTTANQNGNRFRRQRSAPSPEHIVSESLEDLRGAQFGKRASSLQRGFELNPLHIPIIAAHSTTKAGVKCHTDNLATF